MPLLTCAATILRLAVILRLSALYEHRLRRFGHHETSSLINYLLSQKFVADLGLGASSLDGESVWMYYGTSVWCGRTTVLVADVASNCFADMTRWSPRAHVVASWKGLMGRPVLN